MKSTSPITRPIVKALAFALWCGVFMVGLSAQGLAANRTITLKTPSADCGLEKNGWRLVTPQGKERPAIVNNSAANTTLTIKYPENTLKICKVIELGDQEIILASAGLHGTSEIVEVFVALVWDYLQNKQVGGSFIVGDRAVENPANENWVEWSYDETSLDAIELESDAVVTIELSERRRKNPRN